FEENHPEIKEVRETWEKAKQAVQDKKEEKLTNVQKNITDTQTKLNDLNQKLTAAEIAQKEKDYAPSQFNFDFNENMSDTQKAALEKFKSNFEKNKDKYEEVAKATGMPAELIAAIHWRESSGDFGTYLHNGQKLGQTTTLVPAGIYFENWTDAAVDAINRCKPNATMEDDGSLDYYLNYAEGYNGWGYKNKGKASPYVWAGTDNYSGGKYVADGVYDPNHVDQQLGVALMMKALMA
ncbi:hypothetical protein IJC60_01815, partial [bacterium]|nr:hypothetical protein [bacterium]